MWFLAIVLILGAVLIGLAFWLRNKNIGVKWYEWLIGTVGLFLLLFALQNLIGTFSELYSQPAWILLAMFGVPALILLAVAGQLVWRRQRAG